MYFKVFQHGRGGSSGCPLAGRFMTVLLKLNLIRNEEVSCKNGKCKGITCPLDDGWKDHD